MTQSRNDVAQGDPTKIFRMPVSDPTSPNLMNSQEKLRPMLAIVKGPHAGAIFELTEDEVTLGRNTSNSVFLNDMTVSRHHASMDLSRLQDGVVTIKDLGSLNGTWVDGAIVNSAELHDGSSIQIGTFRMIFHMNLA